MTPKPTRGGARKGAGRKPRTIKRKSITVRLNRRTLIGCASSAVPQLTNL